MKNARETFLDFLQSHGLAQPGTGFLVAVSGGPDSMAMLHLFSGFKDRLGFRVEAAHLNHGLRGAQAEEDAKFVERECGKRGVALRLLTFDVGRYAGRHRISVETAGHRIRRHLLLRLAAARRLSYVAFGHNADDQAETVFMNLVRGAGRRGLAGIPPVLGPVIHPLLSLSRGEILAFLQMEGIAYRHDPTNTDTTFFRNRMRHRIFPFLEKEVGGSLKSTLFRVARIFHDEEDWLESQTTPLFAGRFSSLGYGVFRLSLARGEFHPAMERRLLRKFVERVTGTLEGINYSAIERMRALLGKPTGKRLELGDLVVERFSAGLVAAKGEWPWRGEVPLPAPGEAWIPELGVRVCASILTRQKGWDTDQDESLLDYDRIRFSLTLRTRRQGDFFHPAGMKGKKKLQDYFVDRKVPRILRDRLPLLADAEGVVWIGNHAVDRRVRVTSQTERVLRLKFVHE